MPATLSAAISEAVSFSPIGAMRRISSVVHSPFSHTTGAYRGVISAGVVMGTYEPAGDVVTGSFALD